MKNLSYFIAAVTLLLFCGTISASSGTLDESTSEVTLQSNNYLTPSGFIMAKTGDRITLKWSGPTTGLWATYGDTYGVNFEVESWTADRTTVVIKVIGPHPSVPPTFEVGYMYEGYLYKLTVAISGDTGIVQPSV